MPIVQPVKRGLFGGYATLEATRDSCEISGDSLPKAIGVLRDDATEGIRVRNIGGGDFDDFFEGNQCRFKRSRFFQFGLVDGRTVSRRKIRSLHCVTLPVAISCGGHGVTAVELLADNPNF